MTSATFTKGNQIGFTKDNPGKGKSSHKFTFTYQDMSLLTGLGVPTLRKYRAQGKFDPGNFKSVVEFVAQRLRL